MSTKPVMVGFEEPDGVFVRVGDELHAFSSTDEALSGIAEVLGDFSTETYSLYDEEEREVFFEDIEDQDPQSE